MQAEDHPPPEIALPAAAGAGAGAGSGQEAEGAAPAEPAWAPDHVSGEPSHVVVDGLRVPEMLGDIVADLLEAREHLGQAEDAFEHPYFHQQHHHQRRRAPHPPGHFGGGYLAGDESSSPTSEEGEEGEEGEEAAGSAPRPGAPLAGSPRQVPPSFPALRYQTLAKSRATG